MSAVALGRGALHGCREFAGWELVHAASSMVVALLQLLVAVFPSGNRLLPIAN